MDRAEARRVGETCMGLHVRRAARRITRMYDDALLPVQLTIGQFSLMTILAGRESWGMQPLADMLGTDRTSLTATLKPLERRQLVASDGDPSDRRLRRLRLTSTGVAKLADAKPLWMAVNEQAVDLLGLDNSASIRSAFSRLS